MQPGTLIDTSKFSSAGQWLAHLSQVQHQRFSGRMAALAAQGVHPADGWQMAALHQRTADVPGYAPTPAEQALFARTRRQVAAVPPSPEGIAVAASGDRPGPVTDPPSDRGGSGDPPTPPTDGWGIAQTMLDHGLPLMHRAIAAGTAPATDGGWQLANDTYRVTLSAEGELRVENRRTGGEMRGTAANGVQSQPGAHPGGSAGMAINAPCPCRGTYPRCAGAAPW
jgi:hypothetical protein